MIHATPTSDDERAAIAHICQIDRDIRLPMLLDGIDNDVESKFVAAPLRLFVIDREGRITYNGGHGPRGFDPEAWRTAIIEQVADPAS